MFVLESGGLDGKIIGISVGSTVGIILIVGLLILAVGKRKLVYGCIRRMTTTDGKKICKCVTVF